MKEIKLTRGGVCLVDDEDYPLLSRFNWAKTEFKTSGSSNFYATTTIGRKIVYIHQLIMPSKPHKYLVHISKNVLDNRKANLQLISNNHRRHIGQKKQFGYSKYRGVQRLSSKKWRVVVARDKVRYHGGDFAINEEDKAGLTYNKLAKKIYGEFAYQNNII